MSSVKASTEVESQGTVIDSSESTGIESQGTVIESSESTGIESQGTVIESSESTGIENQQGTNIEAPYSESAETEADSSPSQTRISSVKASSPTHLAHSENRPKTIATGKLVEPSHIHYQVGDVIDDRYIVEKQFQGGMGYVYIARDRYQDLVFAIKQPKKEMLANKEIFSRVLREADAWTSLGMHPHIAYCYFVKNIDEIPYIFVEYVDGGNLKEWVAEGRCFDYKIGLDIAIQFCHGMEKAHGKGMVHRDIKSENALMTKDGKIKVTDFGLVGGGGVEEKIITHHQDLQNVKGTMYGMVMGTMGYMAPEQRVDSRKRSDAYPDGVWFDSDVYSFGICLWEMFLQKRPYRKAVEMMNPPPDPKKFREDLPDSLRDILLTSIAIERSQRIQDFTQLRQQLNQVYHELYQQDAPNYELQNYQAQGDDANNQGYSYYQLNAKEDAIHCFRNALKIDPSHPQATYNLSLLDWNQGKIDDQEVLRRLKNCRSNPMVLPEVLAELSAYIHAQRADIKSVQQALQDYPDKYQHLFSNIQFDPITCVKTFSGHQAEVNSITLVADGSYFVSGDQSGEMRLWKLKTGEFIRSFSGHQGAIQKVLAIPKSRFVFSASSDSNIKMWDLKSGRCVHTFVGHTDVVTDFVVINDAKHKHLYSSSYDKTIRIWDIATAKPLRILGEHLWGKDGHSDKVYCLAHSNQYLASAGEDRVIKIWDIKTERCVKTFSGHQDAVSSLAVNPQQWLLVSASKDKTLREWNLETGECIKVRRGHVDAINAVAVSQSYGRFLVSAGGFEDKVVKLWKLDGESSYLSLMEHTDAISDVLALGDLQWVLSASYDKTIKLWKISSSQPYQAGLQLAPPKGSQIREKESEILDYVVGQAEKLCRRRDYEQAYAILYEAWGDAQFRDIDAVLKVYRKLQQKGNIVDIICYFNLETIETKHGKITAIALFNDNQTVISAGLDKSIQLWNIKTGECLHRFKQEGMGIVNSLALSHHNKFAISGSSDRQPVNIWGMKSKKLLHQFPGHADFVTKVAISANDERAVSMGGDGDIRLWSLASGKQFQRLRNYNAMSVAIDAMGDRILVGSEEGIIKLWCLGDSDSSVLLRGHLQAVQAVWFHPQDKDWAFSGDISGEIRIWDLQLQQCDQVITAHNTEVLALKTTNDGQFLISASADNSIKIWDYSQKPAQCIETILGHTDAVTDIAISDDKDFLVSASRDQTIRLWRLLWDLEFS